MCDCNEYVAQTMLCQSQALSALKSPEFQNLSAKIVSKNGIDFNKS